MHRLFLARLGLRLLGRVGPGAVGRWRLGTAKVAGKTDWVCLAMDGAGRRGPETCLDVHQKRGHPDLGSGWRKLLQSLHCAAGCGESSEGCRARKDAVRCSFHDSWSRMVMALECLFRWLFPSALRPSDEVLPGDPMRAHGCLVT